MTLHNNNFENISMTNFEQLIQIESNFTLYY